MTARMSKSSQPQPQKRTDLEQISKGLIWMESENAVKTEANSMKEKLHAVREKYRKANYDEIKGNNKSFIEWNEDLLSFCKANRRKYQMESRTAKIDRQIFELQMMISQKEGDIEKLREELKEEKEGKDHALNRLSELQSHLLKFGNPEITDLGDKNRPTNLGERYKEIYDNEWTDTFEFLTEKNDKKDPEALEILYAMLKCCSELCSESVQKQHMILAGLITDPLSVKAKTALDQFQSESSTPETKNTTQADDAPVPGKADVAIKEFCKGTANELLENITITDILPVMTKEEKFTDDMLQNEEVKIYLVKSFKLLWLMQTQHPPMFIDFTRSPGSAFDTNVFDTYTNRGPEVEQIVWPPVYLQEGGPLVSKGVAQGRKQS